VPPFELKVIFEFHLAKNVTSLSILVPPTILVPPSCAEYQPTNEWLVLVGVGNPLGVEPEFTITVLGLTVPPLGFNVMVRLITLHLAKNVTLLFTTVLAFIWVPAVCAVNQPSKVCPALVGIGSIPTVAPEFTVLVVVLTVPPFGLNVTV